MSLKKAILCVFIPYMAIGVLMCCAALEKPDKPAVAGPLKPMSYPPRDYVVLYNFAEVAFEHITEAEVPDGYLFYIDEIKFHEGHFSGKLEEDGKVHTLSGSISSTRDKYVRIQLTADLCLPLTSYAHELMHYFSYLTVGHWDPEHKTEGIWPPDGCKDEEALKYGVCAANAAAILAGLCDLADIEREFDLPTESYEPPPAPEPTSTWEDTL